MTMQKEHDFRNACKDVERNSGTYIKGVCTCEFEDSGVIDNMTSYVRFRMSGFAKPGKLVVIERCWADNGKPPITIKALKDSCDPFDNAAITDTLKCEIDPIDVYEALLKVTHFIQVSSEDVVRFDPRCTAVLESLGISFFKEN